MSARRWSGAAMPENRSSLNMCRFCPDCGTEAVDNALYCDHCGRSLLKEPVRIDSRAIQEPDHTRTAEQKPERYVPSVSPERERRQATDGEWQELREDGYWYPVEGPAIHEAFVGSLLSATPPSAAPKNSTVPAGGWMAIIGGALMIVGAVLPWVTASAAFGVSLSRNAFQLGNNNGFSIDGVVAVIIGVSHNPHWYRSADQLSVTPIPSTVCHRDRRHRRSNLC